MPETEASRYLSRAEELREFAVLPANRSNMDVLLQAAKAYQELASWNPYQAVLRIRSRRQWAA